MPHAAGQISLTEGPVLESACSQPIQTLQRLILVISSPLWMNGNQLVKSASVEPWLERKPQMFK